MSDGFLQFDSISKSFPGVKALDGVTFSAAEGSVHGLVGENGAGKSTLLKILSGAYVPDGGTIRLGGREHHFYSTAEAIQAGVAVIYQDLQLVSEMTVEENLFLGNMPNCLGRINKKQLRRQALEQLAIIEEDIDPRARLGSLPIAQRQMVEIAKALARDAKVIAFDEPTSSLSDREIDKLFSLITQLRGRGKVILYVSHRMEELFRVCDSVTVFRDGRHVQTFDSIARLTREELIRHMVGRSITDIYNYSTRPQGPTVLDVRSLMGPGLAQEASLTVKRGEIVGLFGLVGAGRTELLKLIFGATCPTAGSILVNGKGLRPRHPNQMIRNGLAFCPEDRKKEGIVPIASVQDNINISARRLFSFLGFVLRGRWEKTNARNFVDRLGIKTPSLSQLEMNLSGGNQQKTILARWLSEKMDVMLLDEPTRGIDVGAKREIYEIIFGLARSGVGLLVASSELPEVMGISDRILVMRQGRIVASVPRELATAEQLLHLALPSNRIPVAAQP